MRALVIQHVEAEGPGTLGEFLRSAGASLSTVRLHAGDALPQDPCVCDAVVSMGGPMNVYDEERYPFLRDETEFLRTAVHADVPVVGICLGAQMIAKACGARVVRSPEKEVGWSSVSLTEEGTRDALFRGLPREFTVLQWHEDMFEIPPGASLLATSAACPHQAFRFRNAWGVQFHVEATRPMIADWFSTSPLRDDILHEFDEREAELRRHATAMYTSFLARAGPAQGLVVSHGGPM